MVDLDIVYADWTRTRTEPARELLMTEVLKIFRKMTRDDDATSAASLFVLQRLEGFKPVDESSFTRWIRSLGRTFRMKARDISIARDLHDEYDEQIHTVPDETFFDTSVLPTFEREVAELVLVGHTMAETAAILNLKPATLRKKLERRRHKIASSAD